jgi:hypothetical protein
MNNVVYVLVVKSVLKKKKQTELQAVSDLKKCIKIIMGQFGTNQLPQIYFV